MRSKAFFVNGGYGRMVCSIPALELYAAESGDDDFIIVCEGGTDAYKGHPLLDDRAYDVWQKNLFKEKLKDRELVSTEPYRIFEYYNQECSLSQAFDIQINNKGIRELSKPTMNFSREELLVGRKLVSEVKSKVNKDKTIVIQPFGRGMQHIDGSFVDTSGRSIEYKDLKAIIRALQSEKFVVILMAEMAFDFSKEKFNDEVAMPENVRQWAALIKYCDYFFGCDSVGQHVAYTVNKKSTVVLGSTFATNVSYPKSRIFNIVDLGIDKKMYSPIRLCTDQVADLNNERLMELDEDSFNRIIKSVKTNI